MSLMQCLRRFLAWFGWGDKDRNVDAITDPAAGTQVPINTNINADGTADPATTAVAASVRYTNPSTHKPTVGQLVTTLTGQGTDAATWSCNPFQVPFDNLQYVLHAEFTHFGGTIRMRENGFYTGTP